MRKALFCIQMLKGHHPDEEIIHKIKLTNGLNKKINQVH